MRILEPKLRTAVEKFVAEHEPVASTSVFTRKVMWYDGLRIDFDRVVIPLSVDYDSEAFAYDFYPNTHEADRYVYEKGARRDVQFRIQQGWIPVRLDVWTGQGRKSRPAKPVRLDVWFVTKTDSANQNATRYNANYLDRVPTAQTPGRQRYEGDTW